MCIWNIENVIKTMTVKDTRECTFENHHKRIGFTKEDSYYSLKKQKQRFIIVCY